MTVNPSENWSLCLGRWRGVELRLHILLPLVALIGLLLVVESSPLQTQVLAWALLVLVVSVSLHELVSWITAIRFGGHGDSIILGPCGGFSQFSLPNDPPAHIATSLAGPTTSFVLMVVAACALALAGDENVLRLLNPIDPQIDRLAVTDFDSPKNTSTILPIIGQLTVWINCCLLLVNLLPVEPFVGERLLRSVLWPIVGLSTARSLTSLVAVGIGVLAVLLALVLAKDATSTLVPAWFPLAAAALLLFYGGTRVHQQPRCDVGLAIDQLDSDDELWSTGHWDDDDREAVLVEHLQDKQQEAIDRKRREREASEDARVDAILARLNEVRFEELSEEDRAILKRASRRYRQRRDSDQDE